MYPGRRWRRAKNSDKIQTMPRAKQNRLPSPDIASPLWEVSTEYAIRDGFIVAVGESRQKNYLSARDGYASLLQHFSAIVTDSQALDFVQYLGFPIQLGHPKLEIKRMLQAAAFIQLMMQVSDACRKDIPLLRHWTTEKASEGEMTKVIFAPQAEGIHAQPQSFYGSEETSQDFKYDATTWRIWKDADVAYLYVAQRYIAERLDFLLSGIQPSTHWMQQPTGVWSLIPGLKIDSPWSAICLALYERCTGSSGLRKCRRKGCTQYFVPKNRKKEFCNGAHQRECHRHPELLEPQ